MLGSTAVLTFARDLLTEQKVPLLARGGASRALALLLARSLEARGEPVLISAAEGARLCGFEPRTWWLVKRRLLELGHLLASTGGGPPSGKPGGRGRKGAYFVSPATLERFRETLNGLPETVNGLGETVNLRREERDLSHHRLLRLLEKERTSDVSSFEEGRVPGPAERVATERPTVEAVWSWVQREESEPVKLELLRLLETLLVTEALSREPAMVRTVGMQTVPKPQTVMAPPPMAESVNTLSPSSGKRRIARAPKALWSGEKGEEAQVLSHVRSILEWANREHGARFDVAKVARDTLLYPFERVRSAVANVLLKETRGYAIKNAGAVLWDGITLQGYKFEEFSVATFDEVLARLSDEVLARLGRTRSGDPPRSEASRQELPPPTPSPHRPFEPERQRRLLLQALYEKLPEAHRTEIDQRAEAMARKELGPEASTHRIGLLRADKKNELLAALPSEAIDAGESQSGRQESQISDFGSARDEPEPNRYPAART